MKRYGFQAGMWTVFSVTVLFMALIIAGLAIHGSPEAVISVLKDKEFHYAVRFTLQTTITATFLAGVIAVPCGYILSRAAFPGKMFVEALLDIPIVLPPLVSGLGLLIFFGPIMGDVLEKLGAEIVFTKRGVIAAQCFIAAPFAIKAYKQAFDAIDPRMEKLARTLGYSPDKVFWKVTMPMARNGLIGGITMAWARTLGEFGATAMLAGVTRMKTETLSAAIFLNMSMGNLEFSLVTAVFMLVIALILLTIVKLTTLSRRNYGT